MDRALSNPYTTVGWIALPFVLLHAADGFWKSALLRGPHIWFWAYDLTKWFLLPVLLLALLHRITWLRPRDYGLSADLGKRDIVYVLPLPLLSLFAVNLVATQVSARLLAYPAPPFTFDSVLASLGSLWIVGTIYLSATAGLWESIFLIGLPLLCVSRGQRISKWQLSIFAVGAALVFALGHWENGWPIVIGAFAFQVLAVWWYVRLKTLWPVIGAHFLMDVYYFWPPAKI